MTSTESEFRQLFLLQLSFALFVGDQQSASAIINSVVSCPEITIDISLTTFRFILSHSRTPNLTNFGKLGEVDQ